jgi:protein ImuB
MACVRADALPLQILLHRHPEWSAGARASALPVVVVDRDEPQGEILWVSPGARSFRIRPGMRYATGLSLARELRAGTVSDAEVQSVVDALTERLRGLSPHIEPAREEPGVFWVDVSGLTRLYDSLRTWGMRAHAALREAGYTCRVAVGWSRFGTYILASSAQASERAARERASRDASSAVLVLHDIDEERALASRASLADLHLDPNLYTALERLAVRTVGDFVRLPAASVRTRFGADAHRLHKLATGHIFAPLAPQAAVEIPAAQLDFEPAEGDVHRLLFGIKRHLHALLAALAERQEALTELVLALHLERGHHRDATVRTEIIRPAAPTLELRQILDLVRLRLESAPPEAGIETLHLRTGSVRARHEQLALFAKTRAKDPAAVERDATARTGNLRAADLALARVRADLGDEAVVRACLRDGHLPEASYTWEPLHKVVPPRPHDVAVLPLVRRLHARPQPLPPQARRDPDGWLLDGLHHGHVVRCDGPYIVSGGWWATAVHREYHFAETRDRSLYWIYYDRKRRSWFVHGYVE